MASKLEQHGFHFTNPSWGKESSEFFHMSHAVIIPPTVQTVVVSGQVGFNPDGSVPSELVDEIEEAFSHVRDALQSAGLGADALENVYEMTLYYVATAGIDSAISTTVKKLFKSTRPTTVGVGVNNLFDPRLHLEVKVAAFLPTKTDT